MGLTFLALMEKELAEPRIQCKLYDQARLSKLLLGSWKVPEILFGGGVPVQTWVEGNAFGCYQTFGLHVKP
jgi:hypothetical protein